MSDLIDRQAAIDECNKRGAEHIGYAIAHLPSAHPEPCEDAVSRQDVIDILEMYPFTEYSEYEAAREVVKRLPPVQPERESIKWIPHESIFGGPDERVYTCDKCGYNIGFHVENFCPNCGGKYERYEKKEGER